MSNPIRKFYKTELGTELPLLNLRGKEYLEVKFRIVWFREDHPQWSIETEMISLTDTSAFARATIKDEAGRIIATSHKFEDVKGFPDFAEKAETGSIGRALALLGYGTQFCADELDEGKRIVDSPVETPAQSKKPNVGSMIKALVQPKTESNVVPMPAKSPIPEVFQDEDYGNYMCTFGRKYKGKRLKEIDPFELNGYVDWLKDQSGSDRHPSVQLFIEASELFLESREFNRDGK